MKVAIGIPTYNRRHLVELHASSLCSSRLPSETALIVIDDASTDYDVAYLKSIYPEIAIIQRRSEKSAGADFATRDMMEQLVATGADALLLLDSDMIVAKNFLEVGIRLLRETDGVLSLFNTPSHPAVGSRGPFVLKKTVGAAATFWRRDVALQILAGVPAGPRWDWRFCDFLINAGYEISVTRNSLTQHAGFGVGQNSDFGAGDFGVGFSDEDAQNAYRMTETLISISQSEFRYTQSHLDAQQSRLNSLRDEMQSQINALQTDLQSQINAVQTDLQSQLNALQSQTTPLLKSVKRIESLLGLRLSRRIARFVRNLFN